jgi:hypothetical protein
MFILLRVEAERALDPSKTLEGVREALERD